MAGITRPLTPEEELTMTSTFLSKEDVATLTGAKIKTKQIEQLRKMGLPFWVNAQGQAVVPRSAIDGRRDVAPVKPAKPVPYVLRPGYDGKR